MVTRGLREGGCLAQVCPTSEGRCCDQNQASCHQVLTHFHFHCPWGGGGQGKGCDATAY